MSEAPVYIGSEAVAKALEGKWGDLVTLVENALKSFSDGKVIQPVRSAISINKHNGHMLTMPAYDQDSDSLATKLVTLHPGNKNIGIPTIQAVVLLYDASNGKLKAIMDGIVITNMRTAAASMVATKYLARKDPKYMSILGAGTQARSHYQVMKHFYNFEKITVWNVNKESGQKLVEEIRKDGQKCEFCSTVEEAVKEADIINVVSMATKPILKKEWVKEGAHINGVGAHFPDWQELEPDLVLSSVVYVDSVAGASVESGDLIKSGAEIYAEIGEVIAGRKEAFTNKTTLFKSLGMAVEDVVSAELVYKNHFQTKSQNKSSL